MARSAEYVPEIDRRRLLTAAAGITAAGILPIANPTGEVARAINEAKEAPLALEIPSPNVSAATARRLLEIARRNEIRRNAKLPLLSIAKELRMLKRQQDLEEFQRFAAVHGAAVWEQVLNYRRQAEGNPQWRPGWMESMRYQNEVRRILRERFITARRSSRLG